MHHIIVGNGSINEQELISSIDTLWESYDTAGVDYWVEWIVTTHTHVKPLGALSKWAHDHGLGLVLTTEYEEDIDSFVSDGGGTVVGRVSTNPYAHSWEDGDEKSAILALIPDDVDSLEEDDAEFIKAAVKAGLTVHDLAHQMSEIRLEEDEPSAPAHSDTGLVAKDGSDTQQAGADAGSAEGRAAQRQMVYEAIKATGEEGVTDAELETTLGLDYNSFGPRRRELITEGRVIDSGRRRPGGKGVDVTVWVAAQPQVSSNTGTMVDPYKAAPKVSADVYESMSLEELRTLCESYGLNNILGDKRKRESYVDALTKHFSGEAKPSQDEVIEEAARQVNEATRQWKEAKAEAAGVHEVSRGAVTHAPETTLPVPPSIHALKGAVLTIYNETGLPCSYAVPIDKAEELLGLS